MIFSSQLFSGQHSTGSSGIFSGAAVSDGAGEASGKSTGPAESSFLSILAGAAETGGSAKDSDKAGGLAELLGEGKDAASRLAGLFVLMAEGGPGAEGAGGKDSADILKELFSGPQGRELREAIKELAAGLEATRKASENTAKTGSLAEKLLSFVEAAEEKAVFGKSKAPFSGETSRALSEGRVSESILQGLQKDSGAERGLTPAVNNRETAGGKGSADSIKELFPGPQGRELREAVKELAAGLETTGKTSENTAKADSLAEKLLAGLEAEEKKGGSGKNGIPASGQTRKGSGSENPSESVLQSLEKDLKGGENSKTGKNPGNEAVLEKILEKEMRNFQGKGKSDSPESLSGALLRENGQGRSTRSDKAGDSVSETRHQLLPGQDSGEKAGSRAGRARGAAASQSFESRLQSAENRIVSQVSVKLGTGLKQGSGSMTLNMHPPELGSLKVKINSDHGSLNVQLQPQNQQVAGILERNLPALHQSLADQGLDISDIEVGVGDGEDSPADGFRDNNGPAAEGWGNPAAAADEEKEAQPGQPDGQDQPFYGRHGQGLSLRI